MKYKVLIYSLIWMIITSLYSLNGYAVTRKLNVTTQQLSFNYLSELKQINNQKKAQVEKLIFNYEHKFVEAINEGDYKKLSPYLLSGSKICIAQKNTISSYFHRNIKERLISFKIKSITELPNGDFKVIVNEKLYIKIGDSPMEYKEFENAYKVVKTSSGYKLSQIIFINLIDSNIILN